MRPSDVGSGTKAMVAPFESKYVKFAKVRGGNVDRLSEVRDEFGSKIDSK
jgi:hypothetical protein